jgi:EmrB/QacA subfamily drug resistance transporter
MNFRSLPRATKWPTLAGLSLGVFLAALDQTVVSTVGPLIEKQLQFTPQSYPWMTTAYLLGSTVPVPLYGQLSVRFGRKAVFLAGLTIFWLASVLCGLSQSAEQFIAARVLQGVGSAALYTTAFTALADLFESQERSRSVALLSGVLAMATVVGPLLGGFAADADGWRWVFFLNLPVGLIAGTIISIKMPTLKPNLWARTQVDAVGALLLAFGVVPLLLVASLGRNERDVTPGSFAWTSVPSLMLLGLVLVFLTLFLFWQTRVAHPLIDLTALRTRATAVSLAASFLLATVFLAPLLFLPLFLLNVTQVSHTISGLTVTPLVAGLVAGNVLTGYILSKSDRLRRMLTCTLAWLLAALLWMAWTLSVNSSQGLLTLQMFAVGVGLGPAIPLYTLAVQRTVAVEAVSMATATITFVRQLGGTLGVALLGSLFASELSSRLQQDFEAVARTAPQPLAEQLRASGLVELGKARSQQEAMQRFDEKALFATLHQRLETARDVSRRALDGERLARLAVQNSAFAPQWLIDALDDDDLVADPPRVERLKGRLYAELAELETMSTDAVGRAVSFGKMSMTEVLRRLLWRCSLISLGALLLTRLLPRSFVR